MKNHQNPLEASLNSLKNVYQKDCMMIIILHGALLSQALTGRMLYLQENLAKQSWQSREFDRDKYHTIVRTFLFVYLNEQISGLSLEKG